MRSRRWRRGSCGPTASLFAASSGETGSELWRSDGTPAGTFMVADLWAGPSGSSPASFALLGDELIFTARVAGVTQLWRSDGSAAGTTEIALAGGAQPQVSGGSYAVAEEVRITSRRPTRITEPSRGFSTASPRSTGA